MPWRNLFYGNKMRPNKTLIKSCLNLRLKPLGILQQLIMIVLVRNTLWSEQVISQCIYEDQSRPADLLPPTPERSTTGLFKPAALSPERRAFFLRRSERAGMFVS